MWGILLTCILATSVASYFAFSVTTLGLIGLGSLLTLAVVTGSYSLVPSIRDNPTALWCWGRSLDAAGASTMCHGFLASIAAYGFLVGSVVGLGGLLLVISVLTALNMWLLRV